MIKTRVGVLMATLVAWGAPTALAMWLDVERIVRPRPQPPSQYDYEWDPAFQRVFFWFRFGWLLLLVVLVVMVAGLAGACISYAVAEARRIGFGDMLDNLLRHH